MDLCAHCARNERVYIGIIRLKGAAARVVIYTLCEGVRI